MYIILCISNIKHMLPKNVWNKGYQRHVQMQTKLVIHFFNLNHCHFCLLTLQMKSTCKRCAVHFAEAKNGYTVNQDGVQEGRQNMKFWITRHIWRLSYFLFFMNKNVVNRLETFGSIFSIQLLRILYFVFPSYLKMYGIRATDCINNWKPNLLFIFFLIWITFISSVYLTNRITLQKMCCAFCRCRAWLYCKSALPSTGAGWAKIRWKMQKKKILFV